MKSTIDRIAWLVFILVLVFGWLYYDNVQNDREQAREIQLLQLQSKPESFLNQQPYRAFFDSLSGTDHLDGSCGSIQTMMADISYHSYTSWYTPENAKYVTKELLQFIFEISDAYNQSVDIDPHWFEVTGYTP